jgi:hypothetical protein
MSLDLVVFRAVTDLDIQCGSVVLISFSSKSLVALRALPGIVFNIALCESNGLMMELAYCFHQLDRAYLIYII